MPELPEVETVRRGLQPAMEGAKIVKAEARRKDLRFPFQKDFIARLEGQIVTGLGRRAKYLMADLSSGDVLLMHLGMSGSFRIEKPDKSKTPGEFHHPRGKDAAHDHVLFRMSSGADIVFNDPRRFGYMKIIARAEIEEEPLLKGLGPEPLGNEFDAAMLARACAAKSRSVAMRCDWMYIVVANVKITANMPMLASTGSQWRRTNLAVRYGMVSRRAMTGLPSR